MAGVAGLHSAQFGRFPKLPNELFPFVQQKKNNSNKNNEKNTKILQQPKISFFSNNELDRLFRPFARSYFFFLLPRTFRSL